MKKKLCRLGLFLLTITCVIIAGLYVSILLCYQKGFGYNTYINGIYCTGLSVSEVNEILKKDYQFTRINITSDFFEEESILLSDIDYSLDFTSDLEEIKVSQSVFLWPCSLFDGTNEYTLTPVITFNQDKLLKEVTDFKLFESYSVETESVTMILYDSDLGYYLSSANNLYVSVEDLVTYIEEALKEFRLNVFVSESFLLERSISDLEANTLNTWNVLSDFLKHRITFDMGKEQIALDAPLLSMFVERLPNGDFLMNQDGSLYVSKEAVCDFVDNICDTYDTYKKERIYTTYKGETKTISLSTYGTLIDRAKEYEYLYNALLEKKEETHIPAYIHEGFAKGIDDIGDTVIEVDLTNQYLYYLSNGDLVLECDIVSGKPNSIDATPEVVASVFKKQERVYLRGDDYISFVNYWMPFYGADGFHDASWQKEFGGSRYLKYGSHGCINMRYNDAKTLYDMVEIGTPVVVYK